VVKAAKTATHKVATTQVTVAVEAAQATTQAQDGTVVEAEVLVDTQVMAAMVDPT
jgi:hypothetical protein